MADHIEKKCLRTIRPAVDIFRNEESYLIVADVPGVSKPDLTVEVEGQELVFAGVRGDDVFRRRFDLPADIDTDKISAGVEAGVLTMTLPRLAAARPRQISIQ